MLKQGGLFAPISREGALVVNNLLLTTACATVLFGTLYPLALEQLTGEKITVGAPFFNLTCGVLLLTACLAAPFGFSLAWTITATLLVWAGPAQVILISALGAGASLIEVAVAVGLSAVRLLPMVVAMLPMIKQPDTRAWKLVLPAHFTAVSLWVEAMRLLPKIPRESRIAFCNGLGTGYGLTATTATVTGFYLAASLPPLMSAALLFLTPLAFLMSTLRNAGLLVDRLALALGLILGPLFAWWQIGLDLMWSGVAAGTAAYALHRVREALR